MKAQFGQRGAIKRVRIDWQVRIADKGLLLNVGCSNQGLILLAGGCRQKAAIDAEIGLLYRFFSDVGFRKNVLSFKGRESLEVVDQDYGLGPPSAVITGKQK
jgi:hypothetical protein